MFRFIFALPYRTQPRLQGARGNDFRAPDALESLPVLRAARRAVLRSTAPDRSRPPSGRENCLPWAGLGGDHPSSTRCSVGADGTQSKRGPIRPVPEPVSDIYRIHHRERLRWGLAVRQVEVVTGLGWVATGLNRWS